MGYESASFSPAFPAARWFGRAGGTKAMKKRRSISFPCRPMVSAQLYGRIASGPTRTEIQRSCCRSEFHMRVAELPVDAFDELTIRAEADTVLPAYQTKPADPAKQRTVASV